MTEKGWRRAEMAMPTMWVRPVRIARASGLAE